MTDQSLSRARAFIASMASDIAPNGNASENFGEYSEEVAVLAESFESGGVEALKRTFTNLPKHNPKYDLLRPASLAPKSRPKGPRMLLPGGANVPGLPEEARMPEGLGRGACPWLDDYVAMSRKWSPRGYDGFHEAIGLWVLSTIASRRVCIPLGAKMQYSMLYVALVARSGLYAKSTTASIGKRVIKSAGLGYLLAGDDYTPQAFLKSMSGIIPGNFAKLSGTDRSNAELGLAFAGQKGWIFDEFSEMIEGMRKKSGHMSNFSQILRRLFDGEEDYSTSTIERGENKIRDPYLALQCNMTPADLRSSGGRKGSELWSNGFFARVAFVGPRGGEPLNKGRLPNERFVPPSEMLMKLRHWHDRLGIPPTTISDDTDNPGKFVLERGEFPENICVFGEGVEDAFYRYGDALQELINSSENHDLDSNYGRLADIALHIALLIASLENNGVISMPIWALAQEIAEHWRANLHNIFSEINEITQTDKESVEEKILSFVDRWREQHGHAPSLREIRQHVYGASSDELKKMVEAMVLVGRLEEIPSASGRTRWFRRPVDEDGEVDEIATQKEKET